MKHRPNPFIAFAIVLASSASLKAADQYWNPSPLTGNWANPVWSATSGGGSLTTWTASNNAIFDQAGTYTATINANQTATNINIKTGAAVTFDGSNTVSSNNLTIDSAASLTAAGNRFLKSGTTSVTVNGTLNLSAISSGGNYIQLGGSGLAVNGGGFRHSGNASFGGNIQDVSAASRAAIIWNGGTAGTFTLSGNNSGMTGDVLMAVNNSVIKLNSANAIGSNSLLAFSGGASSTLVELAAGDFTRTWFSGSAATNNGGISWAGTNAGFYATGADRNFTLVTAVGGSTASNVSWGGAGLTTSTVVLGATAATHKLTWTNNIDLNNATRTFNIGDGAAAVDAELSGIISGAAATNSLTKTGTGVLALSNTNTYGGTTTISAGALSLGNGGSTGSLSTTGTIVNNANLIIDRSNDVVQGTDFSSAAITGSGSFTQAGAGKTTFTVANSYVAATNVQNGTLQLNAALAATTTLNLGNDGNSGKVVMGNAAALAQTVSGLTTNGSGTTNSIVGSAVAVSALTVNLASGTNTFSGTLGGTGTNENSLSLTKSGAGTLMLSSANSYSGGTAIADSQGVVNPLRISHSSALGSGTLTIGSFGNNDQSRLELTEGITVANTIAGLTSRSTSNDAPNILNVSGDNTINSNISAGGGGDRTTLQSDSDKLTMAGNVSVRILNLFGDGDGEIQGSTTVAATYGLNKTGAGTWTLNNGNLNNTAATISDGKLVVNGTLTNASANVDGGTLEFTAASSQRFAPTTNGVSNKITGTGTLSLKGAFDIVLTGANTTNGNSWTLVDVGSLTETFDASFTVPGFTESANVWTRTAGGNAWTFDEATGILSLVSSSSGFSAWITGSFANGSVPPIQQGPDADFDKDGMANLVEYALSGDPTVSDSSILPDLVVTATDFEFTYSRLDLSLADTVQTFEYGSDLDGWTPIVIPAGPGIITVGIATITVTNTGSTDSVKISIPRSVNVGGKLFGRLKVVK